MLFSLWESCNSTFVCPKDPSRGWHWQVWSMCRTPGLLSTAESFTWQRSHPEISWFCLHLSDFGDTQENAFGQQTMIDYKQQKNTYWYTYIYMLIFATCLTEVLPWAQIEKCNEVYIQRSDIHVSMPWLPFNISRALGPSPIRGKATFSCGGKTLCGALCAAVTLVFYQYIYIYIHESWSWVQNE